MKTLLKKMMTAFFVVMLLCYGCKKNDPNEQLFRTGNQVDQKHSKEEIIKWINLHEKSEMSIMKQTELLKQNLEFESMSTTKRKNGEDVLIVPVKDGFREKLKLSNNYSLKMITIKKAGRLRWSMIVCYLPDDGKGKRPIQDKSIRSIVNNEPMEEDGLYKFFDLTGRVLYQVSYKNKRITSYGNLMTKGKKDDVNKVAMGKENSSGQTSGQLLSENCTDWYLVTTYYDEYGNVERETWDYQFTKCEGGGNDGGGGGGDDGGTGTPPEDPVDVELTHDYHYTIGYTDYDADDYHFPEDNLGATPAPSRLTYTCFVSVSYMVISRTILSAVASPLTVTPVRETYIHEQWGTVTRYITPMDARQDATYSGRTIKAYWKALINFTWTYHGYGTARTKQVPFEYAPTMILP